MEGQKLKADADSFLLKLNTRQLFDDWSNKVFTVEKDIAMTSLSNYSFVSFRLLLRFFRLFLIIWLKKLLTRAVGHDFF